MTDYVLLEDMVDGQPVWRLTMEREASPGITQTTTIEWSHEPTLEELEAALTAPDVLPGEHAPRAGDHLRARKVGPFTWWSEVGPPPWRFPRFQLRPIRGMVRVGWRYTAFAVTWNWPWRHRP